MQSFNNIKTFSKMKTKFTLLMMFVAITVIQANAQWANIVTNSVKDLTTIAASGSNVVVAGYNGSILHSGDGGLTFSDSLYYPYDPVMGAAFLTTTTVVLGINNHTFNSINSGATFTYSSTGVSSFGSFRDLTFVSASNGFAVDDNCYIASTTDGGNSWTKIANPCGSIPTMSDIDFPTATTGYVCGANGHVYKTTDGGTNWTAVTAPAASTVSYTTMQFFDVNNGFITGHTNNGLDTVVFKKTTDGGATWIDMKDPLVAVGFPLHGTVSSFSFLNPNVGYVIDWNKIYKTTDGGASWSLDYTSTVADAFNNKYGFNEILATPSVVIAVGAHGLVARATGSGSGIAEARPTQEISVYPNPSSNSITLGSFLVKNENAFLEIRDVQGKLVKAEKIASNSIDISNFQSGFYLGKLVNNSGDNYTFKFVKQ
jgi:photosystem II stability/assembly factor-like uncharacterized protein